MKGFIAQRMWTRAVLLACGGMTLTGTGCYHYRDLVDPCYPERYQYMARKEVNSAFATQVHRGHSLNQTVWNYHFEYGSDRLTAMGLDHLAMLARQLPHPDTLLYLQTAQDVGYDPSKPEKLAQDRQELNDKRIMSIQKFMLAQTAGKGYDFQVAVHDPSEIGLPAIPVGSTISQMYTTRFRGGLQSTGGGGTSGGGGAPQQ